MCKNYIKIINILDSELIDGVMLKHVGCIDIDSEKYIALFEDKDSNKYIFSIYMNDINKLINIIEIKYFIKMIPISNDGYCKIIKNDTFLKSLLFNNFNIDHYRVDVGKINDLQSLSDDCPKAFLECKKLIYRLKYNFVSGIHTTSPIYTRIN